MPAAIVPTNLPFKAPKLIIATVAPCTVARPVYPASFPSLPR